MIRQFKILRLSEPKPDYGGRGGCHVGRIATADLLLVCPLCGMQFSGVGKSSSLGSSIFPDVCPNCNFPDNVFTARSELWRRNRDARYLNYKDH